MDECTPKPGGKPPSPHFGANSLCPITTPCPRLRHRLSSPVICGGAALMRMEGMAATV